MLVGSSSVCDGVQFAGFGSILASQKNSLADTVADEDVTRGGVDSFERPFTNLPGPSTGGTGMGAAVFFRFPCQRHVTALPTQPYAV